MQYFYQQVYFVSEYSSFKFQNKGNSKDKLYSGYVN